MTRRRSDGAERESPDGLLHSRLADDPGLADLLADFVAGLPRRMAAIAAALDAGDLARVTTLAHSTKGATTSYGFPRLADLALVLERTAAAGDVAATRSAAEALAAACASASPR